MSQDYIRKFREFRAAFSEETGIKDEALIEKHWELYLIHFLCMCDECEGTTTIHAPDVSYYPQWPDRFDEPEDEDEGGLTP